MTLALYGKTRRRQGVLIALALFTLFAAIIGAATVRQPETASAVPQTFAGPFTFTGSDNGTVGDGWTETETASRTGNAARLRNGGTIYRTISTLGYTSIVVNFSCRGDTDNDASDDLAIDYRLADSGSWTNVAILNTDIDNDATGCPTGAYASRSVSLAAIPAVNQLPTFQLRFRSVGHTNSDEEVRIDDVSVQGEPTPPTNEQACAAGDVNACIALLGPVPPLQQEPEGVCSGINANFVIDVSGSVNATELAAMKSGIQSFSNIFGTTSKYSAVKYASSTALVTTGYIDQPTFHTTIGAMTNSGVGSYTWTEGGIDAGVPNNGNALPGRPAVMFVVTDGSPNLTFANQNNQAGFSLNQPMVWVNAANEAIAAANNARNSYWVRVVRAGPADDNLLSAFGDAANAQLFADAVMERLSAGSVVVTDFDNVATALLNAAGCDPNVLKSDGTAVNNGTQIEWTITLVNPSLDPVTVTVTDANATLQSQVPANACTNGDTNLGDGLNCTIPAKVGQVNGQVVLTVRTPMPAFNVCLGTTVSNTVYVDNQTIDGEATGQLVIPANPGAPECLGTIKVVKVEEGGLTATSDTWNFGLSAGPTSKPDISIPNSGNNSFTGLTPGNYTVTELNSQGFVQACTPTVPAGSFVTTSGTTENPQTVGQAVSNIPVVAGQVTTVYFTNTGCAPSVGIAKTSNVETVAAGGDATWTVTVTVSTNPTTADATISDTLPAGWSVRAPGVSDDASAGGDNTKMSCTGPAGATSVSCTLASGAPVGTYTITIPVKAPAQSPMSNCKAYTNTATIAGGGGTVDPAQASDDITVTDCVNPSLALSKTNNTADNTIGSEGTFNWVITATVSNGPTIADATIIDTLPAGFSFNGAITTSNGALLTCATPVGQAVTCTLASGAANGSYTITIPVKAPKVLSPTQCGGNHINTATAAFPADMGNVTGSPATNGVSITCPDVTIAKSAGTSPVVAGTPVTFTITVTNSGPGAASNVKVFDTLSAKGIAWSVTSVTGVAGSVANCTVGASPLCEFATMPVGSITIELQATTTNPTSCGEIPNQASVAADNDGNGTNNTSTQVAVTVNCPDPSVAKSGNGPVTAGDAMVYTITVTAGGTGQQTVTLTDTPPAGVTWTVGGAGVTGQGNCANGAQVTNPASLSCTWENLNPGATRVITLTATSTPAQCGPNGLTNTATITSAGDVNTANNEAQATIVVNCPNVTLTKTANEPATVSAGEDISFTITATNSGAGAAKDFVLYDVVPANMASWTFTNNPDNCAIVTDADPDTPGDQPGVRCPGVGTTTLAANGGSITFTIKGTTTPAACGTVTNTARATASNHPGEITPAQAEVVVRCPDVTVLKVANPATINAGEDAVFNITIDNAGTGVAKNVVLTDTLPGPASLTWSLSGSGATYCNTDGGSPHTGGEVLTCSFGDIAGDATPYVVTLTATTTRDHCGPLANTATVTADNEPANLQPNTSSDTVNVNCADIVFVKSTTTPAISATDVASFKIEVTNPGAGTAFNVVVTDLLPGTGLVWTLGGPDAGSCSSDGSAGHNSGETLTCTFGDMPQGASRSITLTTTTTVGTCPELNNVANLTSSNAGTAQSGAKVVVNCPNITVAKTSTGANPVDAGGDLFYTIDVAVSGPEGTVAKAVILKEDVPANTSGWTILGITGDPLPAGADCTQILSSIICDFGDLTIPADGQLDFHITLSAKAVGSGGAVTCGGDGLTNWAIVQAGNAPEDRDSATVMVDCPNVTIDKTAFASSISSGDEASFTVQVQNTGAGVAKNVTITDDLSGTDLSWNLTVEASSQALANTVDCTANPITGVFICSVPELANGQWVKIHMSATTTPGVCGPIDNTARVTVGNDGSSEAKESQLARITVNCPDVTVDKEPDNGDPTAAVSAGDDATFVITVTNGGPGTAKNVTLKDTLPLGDTLAWAFVPGGDEAGCDDPIVDGVLDCEWASLAQGASVTVTVRATTSVGLCIEDSANPLVRVLPNTATTGASNEDPEETGNNSDTGEITVNCSDVQVEKSADETPIGYFDSASFTINVWNNGPGTAYGVKVVDTLPAGVEWDTTDPACDVDNTAGTITCEFDELAPPAGDEVAKHPIYVYSLDGEQGVRVCGPLVNSVVVSASNEPESATANNSAEATIDVECGTIEVVKIDNVPGNTPNLPANWEFVVTGPNGFNEVRTIASQQGGGNVTIEGVPLGAGYAVAETQAKGSCPTTPSDATWTTTAIPGTPQDLLVANSKITFTFTNNPCGAVLDTGALIIEKFSDINGNGVVDGADAPLSNWPITVSGPQFAQPLQTTTNQQGRVILPSIQSGNYTVTEGTNPNYAVVGVRVNGGALTASTSTQVQVVFGDEDVVTFYNQPRGSIVVTKSTVISVNNGPNTAAPADADGWLITVSSAACGINLTQATGANGQATFTNLPLCSDYVVSENPVNPASPGYVPVGPTSVTSVTPGHPTAVNFTFVNRRLIIDACTNIADCPQATATPTNTPVPPTNTPAPATATPTNTQVPPSPTPEETVGGERTPGPASPTPQAPDTGAGLLGGPVAGMNLMLLVMGLTALAIGFTFVSIGRRKSSIRR